MASIRNSISLQDHMTPVFRTIMKSMDSTLRLMRQLDRASNSGVQSKAYTRAARDIQRANNELLRMQNNLSRVDSGASKVGNTISRSFSTRSLTSFASGLYLIKNALNAISNTMSVPDSLNAAQYRLEKFDTTNATGSQLYNSTYRAAQNSRSSIDSTASLASRILVSGATGGNGGAAIQMAELLNKASFIGGSSNEESKRALLQLSQGLSSGVLQGDELRAIREQSPGLTDTLARGLSSMAERGALPEKFLDTTVGDLKQLGKEGELTADRIIGAFNEMEDYINTSFEESPKQFGQAMTGIGNVWKNFLKQLSHGDNALARLNDKAWEFMEYLESAEGQQFFNKLGSAINFAVNCLIGIIEGVANLISWFNELDESGNILTSMFIALGAYATYSAVMAIVAWVALNWVILAVVSSIALVIYALLSLGVSVGQIVGGIVGVILAAVAIIWNLLVGLSLIISDLIIMAVTAVLLAVQAIMQIILWAIGVIITILMFLGQTWNTLWNGFQIVVQGIIWGIAKGFTWLVDKVLWCVQKIAEGIDWVFGSNLAGAVKGWRSGLGSMVDDLDQTMGISIAADAQDIGDGWKDFSSDVGGLFSGELNLLDNMAGVWNGAGNIMGEVHTAGEDMVWNEGDAFNMGWEMGKGIDDSISKFSAFDPGSMDSLGNLEGVLDDISKDGLAVDGGNLDSVGSVKSDVDISDEDIQLLRDIAARDFLLNVQTITPKANIKFGDVRETADVNKIVEVIEDMVEEQLATSLVTD